MSSTMPPINISHVPQRALPTDPTASLKKSTSSMDDEKIKQTAKEFEAMALGEMLQPMFETVDDADDKFGGGNAEKQFRSMQVLELGKQIAHNGGIGIAKQVYGKMKEMAGKTAQPASSHKRHEI